MRVRIEIGLFLVLLSGEMLYYSVAVFEWEGKWVTGESGIMRIGDNGSQIIVI